MLQTSEMLRLLRNGHHSIEDIRLCYDMAVELGYKSDELINYTRMMLRLIKTEERILAQMNGNIELEENQSDAIQQANNIICLSKAVKRQKAKPFVRDCIMSMRVAHSFFKEHPQD